MSKTAKRILIVFVILLLMAACFVSVGVYAHYTLNKPKYPMPDMTLHTATELPATKEAVLGYVSGLYEAAVNADDVECSWHTDARTNGYEEPVSAPFGEKDMALIDYIRERSGDALKAMYPEVSGAVPAKASGIFRFDIQPSDIISYTAERGRDNGDGEHVDDDTYFINFELDPSLLDADAVTRSEVFSKAKETLAPAFSVEKAEAEVMTYRISIRVSRPYDELQGFEITRGYRIKADILLTEDYAALAPDADGKAVSVELPYEATEKIDFYYYGAHFTQSCVVHRPGDMNALPAAVKVHSESTKDDYTLTFTPSADGIVKIDEDGVMTILEPYEEPLIITMTLEYDGHTYTDDLTVYITELEVEAQNG